MVIKLNNIKDVRYQEGYVLAEQCQTNNEKLKGFVFIYQYIKE